MKQQSLFSVSLLIFFLQLTNTNSQSPSPAPVQQPPPAPPTPPASPAQAPVVPVQLPPSKGPKNVAKILEKAGSRYSIFVRLLRATQEDTELQSQLKDLNNGVTIFVPTDSAFSQLKVGILNSLNDGQKAEIIKFHIVPKLIQTSQFQTETNPVRTQAGTGGRVALNVTTSDTGNVVNLSTGLTNATLDGLVYLDSQIAIYQVSKVLLPLDVFTPKPPAPAPSPALELPKKKAPAAVETPPVVVVPVSSSVRFGGFESVLFFGFGVYYVFFWV